MQPPIILVFDSGVGGLTVYREVAQLLPGAQYVYLADDAAFPYGRFMPAELARRVIEVLGAAIARFSPDLVVVACNTASTVAMPALRAAYAIPFVGTVPAVKPAAALSRSKVIAVLGTPGTVSREYTHDLIIQHAAECRVSLVGAPGLAALAERHWRGAPVADADVLAQIAPCFVTKPASATTDAARTDVVVLACTHYPLLLDVYRRIAPRDVTYLDPAPAIARRVMDLLGARAATGAISRRAAYFTSGDAPDAALSGALANEGFSGLHESMFRVPFPPQDV